MLDLSLAHQRHGRTHELGKDMVPKKIFFTKGVGKHKERLTSFELALRDAGVAAQNLVRVSSIFPPQCRVQWMADFVPSCFRNFPSNSVTCQATGCFVGSTMLPNA